MAEPLQGLGTNMRFVVDGKAMEGAILETIVANGLTMTAQGSSTIQMTTKDPEHLLVKSDWFSKKAEAFLDGLPFVACAFRKQVDNFTLEFEDRDFFLMKEGPQARNQIGPIPRGNKTLQEFVKEVTQKLCPHTDFVCPQLHEQQPREPEKIEPGTGAPSKGFTKGSLTIKGQPADADQENNLSIILAVINEKDAPNEAALAILLAGLDETIKGFASEVDPDEGSSGVFQINPHVHPPSVVNAGTKQNAEEFLDSGWGNAGGAIKLAHEGKKAGEIAALVEEPDEKGKAIFLAEGRRKEAETLLKEGGGAPKGNDTTKITPEPEFFELNSKVNTAEEPEEEDEAEENALSGLEAYLKPGKWLFWKVGNTFYLYTERYLAKCKAIVELAEDTPGVLDIGYDLDHSKRKVSKVTVECRALLWQVPPGQLVTFADAVGPAISRDSAGNKRRWIVLNIERKDITDNATTVELILPEQGKREKGQVAKEEVIIPVAHNPATGNHESQTDATGKILTNSILWKLLFEMRWISQQRYPYVWRGGHDPTFQASNEHGKVAPVISKGEGGILGKITGEEENSEGPPGVVGFDCSGAVSAALHAGGLMLEYLKYGPKEVGPQVAEWFQEVWGHPGPGQFLTVWASPNHCFIEVKVPASMGNPNTEEPGLVIEAPPRASNSEPLFFVARVPGTIVGYHASEDTNTDAYGHKFTARHWPGL